MKQFFIALFSAVISFIVLPQILSGCLGNIENTDTVMEQPQPRGTTAFFGNQQRMNIDGNGFVYSNIVIGIGSSIDSSVSLTGYVKTNHDTRVRIEVQADNNAPNNPAQLTIASGGGLNGVSVDFETGDHWGALHWIGKIGADTHSDMDYNNIHFGSLNESGDGYSTFAVALGEDDDATPKSYVDLKFEDFYLYSSAGYEDFSYTTNEGTIFITGYSGSSPDVIIPNVINGLPVGTISEEAFLERDDITNVRFQDNLVDIQKRSFDSCVGLTNIIIPNKVTNIGNSAFANCSGLKDVIIGQSVKTIENGAFYECIAMTNFTILSDIDSIGSYALRGCPNLIYVNFYGNAPTFGVGVFLYTENVTNYYIYGKTGWPQVPDQFEGRPTALLKPDNYGSGRYLRDVITTENGIIPTNVYINVPTENNQVNANPQLVLDTDQGNSSVSIEFRANGEFFGRIGKDNHEDMDYDGPNIFGSMTENGENLAPFAVALDEDERTAIPRSYVDGLVVDLESRLNPADLADWSYITNNDNTVKITKYLNIASTRCIIPESINGYPVTEISAVAFDDTISVTNVVISDSITNIGNAAFADCYSLQRLDIGENVRRINDDAFSNISALKWVYYRGNAPELGTSIFDGSPNVTNYYIYGKTGWPEIPNNFGGYPTAYWYPENYGSGRYLTLLNISNGIPVLDPFDDNTASTILYAGTDDDSGNYQGIVRYRDVPTGTWIDSTMSDWIMWYKNLDYPTMDWIRAFTLEYFWDELGATGGYVVWNGTLGGYGVSSDTNGNFTANSLTYGSTYLIETNGNYTNSFFDNVIIMLATNAPLTNTLPTITNKQYTIKKIGLSNLYIKSDWTIDGETTRIIGQQYKAITFHSGTNKWYIIGETQ